MNGSPEKEARQTTARAEDPAPRAERPGASCPFEPQFPHLPHGGNNEPSQREEIQMRSCMKGPGPHWHLVIGDFFFYCTTGISRIKQEGEERGATREEFRACMFSTNSTRCNIILPQTEAQIQSQHFAHLPSEAPYYSLCLTLPDLQRVRGGGRSGSYYLPWQIATFMYFQFCSSRVEPGTWYMVNT